MPDGQVATAKPTWAEVNRSRATTKEHESKIVLGDPDGGLSVAEIAQLLNLQQSSVRIYLRVEKQRASLFRRLFEEDVAVTTLAKGILEARRAE